jgi:hypothetical protein
MQNETSLNNGSRRAVDDDRRASSEPHHHVRQQLLARYPYRTQQRRQSDVHDVEPDIISRRSHRFCDDQIGQRQVPFSINLDNGRHEFFGTSKKFPNFKFNFIVTNVLKDEADNGWLDDFASSETMTINFRNGNEPRWSVKMAGSRDASKSFQSCIKTLAENAATSPQATPTSPVPDVPDGSSQPAPTNPVQTVPIKKPKGDSI